MTSPVLKEVVKDSYGRLMAPAIEREIRNAVTEKAENGAFQVFKKTLNQLLMEPPISGQVVLGWDPAFRTGCKLAVVVPPERCWIRWSSIRRRPRIRWSRRRRS